MRHESGFTLVEVVLVIILAGILAFAVIPRSSGPGLTLRAQADQLASDIRYVQALSMTAGQRHCLRINAGASTYSLVLAAGAPSCTTTVEHPLGFIQPVALRNAQISSVTNLPNSFIAFNGQGVPYTDTAATPTLLSAAAVITLGAVGESNAVTVSPVTGRVAVQ